MQQPDTLLAGLAGVTAFLGTVCVLGAAVLFPVGYVGFKVAKWTHSILARRTGPP